MPTIPAERELIDITMQVFSANVMECADQTTLQQTVIAFGKVGVDDDRSDELSVVIYGMMSMGVVI